MATEKNISDLIEITEASDDMVLLIESDTSTNKITKANLMKGIDSSTVSGDISLVNISNLNCCANNTTAAVKLTQKVLFFNLDYQFMVLPPTSH